MFRLCAIALLLMLISLTGCATINRLAGGPIQPSSGPEVTGTVDANGVHARIESNLGEALKAQLPPYLEWQWYDPQGREHWTQIQGRHIDFKMDWRDRWLRLRLAGRNPSVEILYDGVQIHLCDDWRFNLPNARDGGWHTLEIRVTYHNFRAAEKTYATPKDYPFLVLNNQGF